MKKFKRFIGVLLVWLLIFSVVGCSKPAEAPAVENNETPAETPAEKPSEKSDGPKIAKQIVIGRNEDSRNLDPVTQDGNVNIWMFNLALEGLVKTSDDGTKIEPHLAESWDISDDGLIYTFHLKEGVKFSDGTPVKGSDWVWSIKRARDTESSPWKFAGEGIKDVEAPDDNTVVITLKEPWAPILADLAMFNMTVQSKEYFDKVGEEGYTQKPIGTGPYMFEVWKKGEYILLKKNPNYHIAGLPKTEEIKVVVVPDDNTRVMQLQAGQIDIMTFVPFNRMAELDNDPNLVSIGVPSTETRYIVLNNKREPFGDVNVRRAMVYGTDKEAIVKFVLQGYGKPAATYAPESGLYHNSNVEKYPYNPEKAKQLLADAGYPNGFDVELLVRSGNMVYEQIATILKEQWSKIGVNVTIESLESATAVDKYRSMKHHVTLSGWTNDMNDPSQQTQYVFIPETAHNYYTDWVSQEAIDLVAKGKTTIDDSEREAIYKKLQEIHTNEVPMIPVFHSTYPVAMNNNIEGFVQTPLGNYRFENLVKIEK